MRITFESRLGTRVLSVNLPKDMTLKRAHALVTQFGLANPKLIVGLGFEEFTEDPPEAGFYGESDFL